MLPSLWQDILRIRLSCYSMLKEFRVEDLNDFNIGDEINVSAFEVGDKVRVLGKSIGRGFAGHMKGHGFGGGRASW